MSNFLPYVDFDQDRLLIKEDHSRNETQAGMVNKYTRRSLYFLDSSSFELKGERIEGFSDSKRFHEITANNWLEVLDIIKVNDSQMLIINQYKMYLIELASGEVLAETLYRFDFSSHLFGRVFNPIYYDDAIVLVKENIFYLANIEPSPEGGEVVKDIHCINFYDHFSQIAFDSGFTVKPASKVLRLRNGNLVLMVKNLKRTPPNQKPEDMYAIAIMQVKLNPFKIVSKTFTDEFQLKAVDFSSIHVYKNWIVFAVPGKKEILAHSNLEQRNALEKAGGAPSVMNPGILVITPDFKFVASADSTENQPKFSILKVSEYGIISSRWDVKRLYLHRIDEEQRILVLTKVIILQTKVSLVGLQQDALSSQTTHNYYFTVNCIGGGVVLFKMGPYLDLEGHIGLSSSFSHSKKKNNFKFIFDSNTKVNFMKVDAESSIFTGTSKKSDFNQSLYTIDFSSRDGYWVIFDNLLHFENLSVGKHAACTFCKGYRDIQRVWLE